MKFSQEFDRVTDNWFDENLCKELRTNYIFFYLGIEAIWIASNLAMEDNETLVCRLLQLESNSDLLSISVWATQHTKKEHPARNSTLLKMLNNSILSENN